jgi:hypothetical protein
MKVITEGLKKIFILCLSSFIAALIIISIMSIPSPEHQEHIRQIDRKIKAKENELAMINWCIENWPKHWTWYNRIVKEIKIKKYQFFTLPKLNMEITLLHTQRYGANSTYIDVWKRNCSLHLLDYSSYIFILLLCMPLAFSLIMYYLLAPLVEKIAPIKVIKKKSTTENICTNTKRTVLNVRLDNNEHLYLRGDWIGGRTSVNVKTRFMWKWTAPLVTFAADLFALKECWSKENKEDEEGEVTITAPQPDLYIGEIILKNNRAIVIRPKYLIGISDGIKIKAFWNFSIHNILAGKIRQIVLMGKGRVFVYGFQGLQDTIAIRKDHKIESNRMIGYDAHAAHSLCRTETWWHYFRKEAKLFDVKIKDGVFITQVTSGVYCNPKANLLEKSVQFVLNGIGSVLGF